MSYVADAYLDGRSDDILLQGVSICFDQLHEITEYAAYARGAEKTPEGLRWLYNFIKAQGNATSARSTFASPKRSRCASTSAHRTAS